MCVIKAVPRRLMMITELLRLKNGEAPSEQKPHGIAAGLVCHCQWRWKITWSNLRARRWCLGGFDMVCWSMASIHGGNCRHFIYYYLLLTWCKSKEDSNNNAIRWKKKWNFRKKRKKRPLGSVVSPPRPPLLSKSPNLVNNQACDTPYGVHR